MKCLIIFTILFLQFYSSNAQVESNKTKNKNEERNLVIFISNKYSQIANTNALDYIKNTTNIYVSNGRFFFNHGEKFKDKVLIYLDARLINLYGDRLIQYLEKVQCETLEKIEIFFNPPAQFNVQGKNIGIINLVSKTSRQISSFLFKE